jgi:NDP-sugar pyrophosphorylase family protein
MAGLYKRFRDAGYTTPKYLLPVAGGTVLGAVVQGLCSPGPVILVANRRDEGHAGAIRDAVPGARLIFVGDTSGQAETAALGAAEADPDAPIWFHNVDTIVRGRDLVALGRALERQDGHIDVFPSRSPAYSYVVTEGDRVTRIAEKEVVSQKATTGLYGFQSAQRYLAAAARTTRRSQGEFYVSDVYATMLSEGADVRAPWPPDGAETIVLGTPAEYEVWRG